MAFGAAHDGLDWDAVRAYPFAGLGYHSPNMELSHGARLPRKATGFYEQQLVIAREIGDRMGEGNALGNLGIAFHLANGLWTFLITWGLTVTPRSQRVSQVLSILFFLVLVGMAGTSIFGFLREP